MNKILKLSSWLLLGLNCLLLFLLVFDEKLIIPLNLSPLGRMHPLLLHLPIGFVVIMILFIFLKGEFESGSFEKILRLSVTFVALTSVVAALMGLFLSRETGYDPKALLWHKWTGAGLSFVAYLFFVAFDRIYHNFSTFKSASFGLLVLISVAGHFGAEITHGENYLFEAFAKKAEKKPFSDKQAVYEAAILPILEAKCMSCHNDQKTKGELNMSTIAKMMKGGKNGPLFVAGDALNSHLTKRVNLPVEQKEHMPPKGKPQLTGDEIALLSAWITEGADFKKSFAAFPGQSKTKALALKLANAEQAAPEKTYTFSAVSESDLKEVNTPFCSVFPLAAGSPALQAEFYVTKKYDKKALENLSKVKDQIVVLNLAKMPVTDEDINQISGFKNLEKLVLNQTDIKGNTLQELKKCKNLYSLALANTKISKENLLKILDMPSLKEVFLWSTALDETALADLKKKYNKINFDYGYVPAPNEILQLNPPVLVNEEFIIKGKTGIQFKHPLKEVKIRYTVDGSEPDSLNSPLYSQPVFIDSYAKVRALATKDKWLASKQVEYTFFKSNYSPDTAYLIKSPDPKHMGKGGKTLIDLKKGSSDNFNEQSWIAYRGKDMEALFEFKAPQPVGGVNISYLLKTDSYIMPPSVVEIWSGDDKSSLKLVGKATPAAPEKMEPKNNAAINISLPKGQVKYIKLVVKPLAKLPKWHPGKGEPAWFFVDEVFFY